MDVGLSVKFVVDIQNDSVIIQPQQQHKYTIIWLTGLDYNPTLYFQFFLTRPLIDILKNFKIVIPRPPYRDTSILQGRRVISWFDIKDRSHKTFQNETWVSFNMDHIEESRQIISQIISKELNELNNLEKNLFLGGFSQGCAMSLHTAYSVDIQFGGVIGVAGYMFNETKYIKDRFPLIIFHGLNDKLRPWEDIKIQYDKRNCKVELIDGMDHEVNKYQLRVKLKAFIENIIQQYELQSNL